METFDGELCVGDFCCQNMVNLEATHVLSRTDGHIVGGLLLYEVTTMKLWRRR
jgi:hypothetical protein